VALITMINRLILRLKELPFLQNAQIIIGKQLRNCLTHFYLKKLSKKLIRNTNL